MNRFNIVLMIVISCQSPFVLNCMEQDGNGTDDIYNFPLKKNTQKSIFNNSDDELPQSKLEKTTSQQGSIQLIKFENENGSLSLPLSFIKKSSVLCGMVRACQKNNSTKIYLPNVDEATLRTLEALFEVSTSQQGIFLENMAKKGKLAELTKLRNAITDLSLEDQLPLDYFFYLYHRKNEDQFLKNYPNELITLISANGAPLSLRRETIEKSPFLKGMLRMADTKKQSKTINLPNIDKATLSKLLLLEFRPMQQQVRLQNIAQRETIAELNKLQEMIDDLGLEDQFSIECPAVLKNALFAKVLSQIPIQCTASFKAHGDGIISIRIGKDTIITQSRDATVRVINVWDKHSYKKLRTFDTNSFSAGGPVEDGNTIIRITIEDTVKIYDKHTGKVIRTLKGHEGSVNCFCCVAVDADIVVAGSLNSIVKTWDKHTGRELHTLKGHTKIGVEEVALRGNFIFSGSWDETIRIWDKYTGKLLRTLEGHPKGANVIVVDEGTIFAGCNDGTVKIWNLEKFEQFKKFLEKLPMLYFRLLSKIAQAFTNNIIISPVLLSEQEDKILCHFLDTIKENWGDVVEKAVIDVLEPLIKK